MIYFLFPVYNESLNIPNLKKELLNLNLINEIYFVFSDDGSTDNTIEVIKNEFEGLAFTILGDGKNSGPGKAFNTGFEWILANSQSSKDIIATVEADCTSDLTILPKMITISNLGFDLVLASVYAQGGIFEKTSWFRKLISAMANLMMRFTFNIKVLTLSSFYRVYSIELLKKIKENNTEIIKEDGFICMLEILHKAIKLNAMVIEVPTTLKSSKRIGKSKMKVFKTSLKYASYFIRNLF